MKKPYLISVALLLFVIACCGYLMAQTGDLFYRFPPRGDFSPRETGGGERLSRRVVVVVADGLALSGLDFMPQVRGLGRRGAFYTARTESPSMSRVGYTVLATGAKPEVHGVSSNSVKDPVAVGNIFRTARKAGQGTAFVGHSWWLDHFDGDIPLAATDSGLKAEDAREDPPLPPDFRRRVLVNGKFLPVEDGGWRDYFLSRELYDSFGDDPATPRKEDDLRAEEAVRILNENAPDLLFLHLHSPDDEGHRTGSPYSVAYRKASAEADRAVRRVTKALDLGRDTVVVTADHGFSATQINAGHGGSEDTASLVPFVMAGAGVKPGATGEVRQIDIQPTLAVLLGLPFSSHIQGRPVFDALTLDPAVREAREQDWIRARERFIRPYAEVLNIHLAGADIIESFYDGKTWLWSLYYVLSFSMALAVFALGTFLLYRFGLAPWTAAWYGPIVWILYEFLFYRIYVAVYGEYSFSSFADANENIAVMAVVSIALLSALSLSLSRMVGGEAPVFWILRFSFLACLLKAAWVFGFLGWGDPVFHPGGFVLFAGISFYVQTATAAMLLIVPLLLLKRKA